VHGRQGKREHAEKEEAKEMCSMQHPFIVASFGLVQLDHRPPSAMSHRFSLSSLNDELLVDFSFEELWTDLFAGIQWLRDFVNRLS
jgi:hypothetical protein